MLFAILNGGLNDIWDFLFMLAGYVILLAVMMPLHEAAHAFAAVKLGDDTPRYSGRLTLNPLAHIDPIGSLLIVLCGIGYAKPVPVNPRNFRSPRRDMALVALAGPLSNILMALVSLLLFRVVWAFAPGSLMSVGNMLYYTDERMLYAYIVLVEVMARVNLSLAVFNLLPIPPLDGSRIFGALLPAKWTYWMDYYHQYVRMALLLLIVTGVLDGPLSFLIGWLGRGLCALLGLPALL